MNAKIAQAAVAGALDNQGFVQGLMLQFLQRVDKEGRGCTSLRGRPSKAISDTEKALIEDAALTLAIAGCNKEVAKELGQRVQPVRVNVNQLHEQSLPDPVLALKSGNEQQFAENINLVDQLYHRQPGQKIRRLMLAIDATYLERSLVQMKIGEQVGLVGGGWRLDDESQCFVPVDQVGREERPEKAPQILEFVVWDPHTPGPRVTYSIASMPTFLSANPKFKNVTKTHQGNWDMLRVIGRALSTASDVVKGVTFDAHNAHRYAKEMLFGVFQKVDSVAAAELPFWCDLTWEDLPPHVLPRLPLRLAKHKGNYFWCLPGCCSLSCGYGGRARVPRVSKGFGWFWIVLECFG